MGRRAEAPLSLSLYSAGLAISHLVFKCNDANRLGLVHTFPVVSICELGVRREVARNAPLGPPDTPRVQDEDSAVDQDVVACQRVAVNLRGRCCPQTITVAEKIGRA